jgi:HSP20 family molecular chaperone IbpA
MGIYADSKDSFRTLARIASKSIADPPWFAVPVNAQEDQDAVTVHFHVPGKRPSPLEVRASERELLRVRLPKKHPALDSPELSPAP